ncbi:MAG TPA: hypothetical protein DCL47_09320, partial [Pantoea agglomerans]|nr:hypothetical protein [Pantoea agglomerans]
SGDDSVEERVPLFQIWRDKLTEWQPQGDALLFLHPPDMGQVCPLVQALWPQLQHIDPGIGSGPDWPQQTSLF